MQDTEQRVDALMEEYLSLQDQAKAIRVRQDEIRKEAFALMNEDLTNRGAEDPDLIPAKLASPATGKSFSREGVGYKSYSWDEDKLRSSLGEGVWRKITTVTFIPMAPAYQVEFLDEELLGEYLKEHPEDMEKVREAQILGDRKTGRLNIRGINEETEDDGL